MTRAAWFLAFALLSLGCASSGAGAIGAEPTPPVRHRAPRAKTNDPLVKALEDNVVRAQEAAERAGWIVQKVIEIPDAHARLVLYRPGPQKAQAYRTARLDAVGSRAAPPLSLESGIIDVVRTRDGQLTWDLRGDGARSVVVNLTPCGASCGVAKPVVLELAADHFVTPPEAPACPECIRDENKDGVPEFEYRLFELKVAPCSRASCGPSVALLVEVRGLESWDGQHYAKDLTEFEPLYFERLKLARQEAAKVKKAPSKQKVCPLNALQVATRVYVFSRLTGEGRADALTAADEIMAGYALEPCKKEYDLLAPPRSWAELRGDLDATVLPVLNRPRPKK